MYQAKTAIAPRKTTPPIAPPAIAPTLVEDPEDDAGVGVGVGVTVVGPTEGDGVAVGVTSVVVEVLDANVIAYVGTSRLIFSNRDEAEILVIAG